jgi:Tol biopolymer transport system component
MRISGLIGIFWLLLTCLIFAQGNLEKHLRNIRQLTFGGENAEAYFSTDGRKLIFQSTREGYDCDQIFDMSVQGDDLRLISTGKGRCTCSFYSPDGKKIIFASTHLGGDECPPPPDYSQGYVWGLYKSYDIFIANPDGSGLKPLTDTYGYDAECVFSPDGKRILFTSDRDGDLELYEMDVEGKHVKRLTNSPGYDGGAFYSLDGEKICFRARVISDTAELKHFQENLKQGLVRPSQLEIFVMNADGSGRAQITDNGSANFCPYFTPDGKKIIFASNLHEPKGRNFELYLIDFDGTGLERITYNPTFDGFPMFSNDGRKLVFCSNRNNKKEGETNVFVAEWIE